MSSGLYHNPSLQKHILGLIDASAHFGRTVAELRDLVPENHHGTISGVLSVMHRDMRIARLAERRNGCKIYVHPDFLDGRAAEAQGRDGYTKQEIEEAMAIRDFLDYWLQVDSDGSRFTTDRTKAERNQRLFFQQLKSLHADRL